MGQDSKIEWTDHTFNPWRGCTKVSHGCTNCYAETLSHRNPAVLGVWGDKGTRVVAADSAWRDPIKWDKVAKAKGERHRVFCASLADVFEDRPELVEPRSRLFTLIDSTPNLDWLLVTKRPQNIAGMWPTQTAFDAEGIKWGASRYGGRQVVTRENVWLLTSVEDQARANERVPELLKHRELVPVLGLSMEPLLEAVDVSLWLDSGYESGGPGGWYPLPSLDWVIVGGESGHGARPMNPRWVRPIRDDCRAASVPFFFKQWGEWAPVGPSTGITLEQDRGERHWFKGDGDVIVSHLGKKTAGRMLDGRTWDELPEVNHATDR